MAKDYLDYPAYIVDNLPALYSKTIFATGESGAAEGRIVNIPKDNWLFAICRIRDTSNKFYWSSHIMVNARENHYIRMTGNGNVNYGQIRNMAEYGKKYIYISSFSYNESSPNSEIELIEFFYFN